MEFKLFILLFSCLYLFHSNAIPSILSIIKECPTTQIKPICPNSNVTFWLYTKNVSEYQLVERDISSIEKAPFLPDRKIVFLIHGWTGDKNSRPNLQIRPKLLQKGYNVISVDYHPAAIDQFYLQSVKNSKTVAKCLEEFINLLLATTNISLRDLHLIGFSLGGQVAGKAGRYLKESGVLLPRITGLDVAGPLFYGPGTYLNKDCAEFVDSIHTCCGRLGKLLPVGHVDFYINGIVYQSGCNFWNCSCHHGRAPEVYAESIDSEVGFFGVNIHGDIKIMGLETPSSARGIYYVQTNSQPPYAKGFNGCNKLLPPTHIHC